MTRDQSRRLFHFYPKVFKPETKEFQEFRERVDLIKTLPTVEDDKNVGKVL